MSTEELLRPRYKVIADYPKSVYEVGTIINAGTTSEDCIYCDREGPRMRHYPHLFKKLEWWEERTIDEMPEYLNCPSRKMFFKVESWHKSYFIIDGRQKMQYRNYIPATLAEYEQYINQKEKQ